MKECQDCGAKIVEKASKGDKCPDCGGELDDG